MDYNSIQINFTRENRWNQPALKVTITATYGNYPQQKLIATGYHDYTGPTKDDVSLTDHKLVKDIVNELEKMLPTSIKYH